MRLSPLALLLMFALSGCASDFKAYSGPSTDDAHLAIITSHFDGCPSCVKEIRKDDRLYYSVERDGLAKTIRLAPGDYIIRYSYAYSQPNAVIPLFSTRTTPASYEDNLRLEEGHTYSIHYDVCFILCFSMDSYTTYIWIIDDATGKVVSGVKP